MKSNNYFRTLGLFAGVTALTFYVAFACKSSSGGGGGGTAGGGLNAGVSLPTQSGTNVLTMTVDGSNCTLPDNFNIPCISISFCAAGGTNCQSVNNILVDTGSFGLRVFKSVIPAGSSLSPVMAPAPNNTEYLTECYQFGDGTALWGSVQTAVVKLGGETPVSVPMEVVDNLYSNPNGSTFCLNQSGSPIGSPSPAAFGGGTGVVNGILGVGVLGQDCGVTCQGAGNANNGIYYACNGTSSCSQIAVPLANQIPNTVSQLGQDNNGVILQLPTVPLGGVDFADGYLVLGIGTQANNSLGSGVNIFPTDTTHGYFNVAFYGQTYSGLFDSGSNVSFFPTPGGLGLVDCSAYSQQDGGLYCPSSNVTLAGTVKGSNAAGTGSVAPSVGLNYTVGMAFNLLNTPNSVYSELAADNGGANILIYGLPFYLGRNVFVAISGKSAAGTTGPFFAY